MMDEIPVIRDDEEKRRRENIKRGGCLLIVLAIAVPVIILAVPIVARLYQWGFGG